jgi:hypothetical protein
MPLDDEDTEDAWDEDDDAAAGMIEKLESTVRFPGDIRDEMETWADKREYVHTLGAVRDTPDTVAANYVLRAQYAATAALSPRDPSPRMLPSEWMPGPESAEGDHSSEWLQNIRAHEIIANKLQEAGGLKGKVRGMIQDTLTEPITWLKVRWVEDPARSPLGVRMVGADKQTTVARYRALKRDFEAGVFFEDDARFYELHSLNRQLKDDKVEAVGADIATTPPQPQVDAFGVPTGDPDPRVEALQDLQSDALLSEEELPALAPFFRSFAFDRVCGEDMRYDWGVTRMEDLYEATWMAQRVWMYSEEIAQTWNLSDEDVHELIGARTQHQEGEGKPAQYAGETEREQFSGLEASTRGDLHAVWEYWDKTAGRVYRWVAGSRRLLDDFEPEAFPTQFYPFVALQFNRVTGKLIGPADSDLLAPLQEEMNMLRTHEREARKSSYPRFMVEKGLLNPTEKRAMRRPIPYSIIEAERHNDIAKSIFPLPFGNFNPALYEGSGARRDFEAMGGAPLASMGITSGADLATEVAVANQANATQNDSRTDHIDEMLARVYQIMMEITAQRMPEANARALAGPGAPWLTSPDERLEVLRNYRITVESVPNGEAARKAEINSWKEMAGVIAQLGLPLNRLALAIEFLRRMRLRANLGSFVDVAALMMPEDPGTTPTNNPPPDPGDQGGRGAEGGRPPTAEKPEVPAPESVPNRPQLE